MGHKEIQWLFFEFPVGHFCFAVKCYARPILFPSLIELSFALYKVIMQSKVRPEKEWLSFSS